MTPKEKRIEEIRTNKIQNFKYKDNKTVIQNKLNKKALKGNYNSYLYKDGDIEKMITLKAKEMKCSKLEASEILRKTI